MKIINQMGLPPVVGNNMAVCEASELSPSG